MSTVQTEYDFEARGTFTVLLDESKFTPEFFEEFSSVMFHMDSTKEAAEYLASLFARGLVDNDTDFIEGFGPKKDFGIRFITSNNRGAWVDNVVDIEKDPYP